MAEKETKKAETEVAEEQLSYEEALKAFKAKWTDKRKEEKKAKKDEEMKAQRDADKVLVANALQILNGITQKSKKELKAVFTRMEMFLSDKKYTRVLDKSED